METSWYNIEEEQALVSWEAENANQARLPSMLRTFTGDYPPSPAVLADMVNGDVYVGENTGTAYSYSDGFLTAIIGPVTSGNSLIDEPEVHQGILAQIENSEPQDFTLFTGREGIRQFEEAMRDYVDSPRPSVVEQMKDINDNIQASHLAMQIEIAKIKEKGGEIKEVKFLGNIGV